MGHQFAQIATEIEAARMLTYNAVRSSHVDRSLTAQARLKEEEKPFTMQAGACSR